jgi:hypothetical protein
MPKDIAAPLFLDISQLIETTRKQVAHYANSALVMLYWQVGQRIHQDVLKNERAGYGENVIKQLALQLTERYGSGFDRPNLSRMVRFAKLYSDKQIRVTLSQQLSWSHFVRLIAVDDAIKRDFYTQMCCLERWSVRHLRQK